MAKNHSTEQNPNYPPPTSGRQRFWSGPTNARGNAVIRGVDANSSAAIMGAWRAGTTPEKFIAQQRQAAKDQGMADQITKQAKMNAFSASQQNNANRAAGIESLPDKSASAPDAATAAERNEAASAGQSVAWLRQQKATTAAMSGQKAAPVATPVTGAAPQRQIGQPVVPPIPQPPVMAGQNPVDPRPPVNSADPAMQQAAANVNAPKPADPPSWASKPGTPAPVSPPADAPPVESSDAIVARLRKNLQGAVDNGKAVVADSTASTDAMATASAAKANPTLANTPAQQNALDTLHALNQVAAGRRAELAKGGTGGDVAIGNFEKAAKESAALPNPKGMTAVDVALFPTGYPYFKNWQNLNKENAIISADKKTQDLVQPMIAAHKSGYEQDLPKDLQGGYAIHPDTMAIHHTDETGAMLGPVSDENLAAAKMKMKMSGAGSDAAQ